MLGISQNIVNELKLSVLRVDAKGSPQPHRPVSFGLLNVKPDCNLSS